MSGSSCLAHLNSQIQLDNQNVLALAVHAARDQRRREVLLAAAHGRVHDDRGLARARRDALDAFEVLAVECERLDAKVLLAAPKTFSSNSTSTERSPMLCSRRVPFFKDAYTT